MSSWIIPFRDLSLADIPKVGGKNASLGEMVRTLGPKGVHVPDGFATTAAGFRHFITANGLDGFMEETLAGLDLDDVSDL